jgi:hypothetical protein
MSEGDAQDALRMIALLRPEGPTLNSHVREGVERNGFKYLEARRAGTHRETVNYGFAVTLKTSPLPLTPSRFRAHLRRSFAFRVVVHALTDVAIN